MDNENIWNLIAKKLAGEASPEELLELEKALRADPGLHYSLQAIQDLWGSHRPAEKEPAEKAFEKHLERLQAAGSDYFREEPAPFPEPARENRSRRVLRTVLIFAGLLLLFTGIYQMTRPHHRPSSETVASTKKTGEVVTQNGTRTKLLLPDGTSVWLNAGSRLLYDSNYDNTLREVSLTGEAFFDVVKNKEKPFIIHTGSIDIKVLGTAFNVKSYPGDKTIETSLIRGRIEVSFKDASRAHVILRPNQKLVVENTEAGIPHRAKISGNHSTAPAVVIRHLSRIGPDSLITETAWVENKLVFRDESFTDLAKQMERWYGIRIRFDDASLDTVHFTGSFEKENIQQALSALQLLSSFSFTIRNGEAHLQRTD